MAFQECFTWISHVGNKLVSSFSLSFPRVQSEVAVQDGIFGYLPDEVIVEILSRLPARTVLNCHRVCRHFQALSSSDYFIEFQRKRATPTLIVQAVDVLSRETLNFFLVDESNKREMIKRIHFQREMIKRIHFRRKVTVCWHNTYIAGYCNGFLLIRNVDNGRPFYVVNPLTQKICVIYPLSRIYVYAFYHTSRNEYKLLCRDMEHYLIYSFGSRKWKAIWTSVSYSPRLLHRPAFFNGALHWIVNHIYYKREIPPCSEAILVFRVDSEEFLIWPHPGKECHQRLNHRDMDLKVKDDKLCFTHVHNDLIGIVIDIWIMKDYANQAWTHRYKVSLNPDVIDYYPRDIDPEEGSYIRLTSVFEIRKEELLFNWGWRGLFVYHLELKSFRQIWRPMMRKCLYYYASYIENAANIT